MGNKWKQWQILFSWAPKSLWTVTTSMKLRHLSLRRKAMTNLDSILKSRDVTLPTKVCTVKVMVFLVVMYRYESQTIKKAECWRTVVFKLWWEEKTLENFLDYKKIKPTNPEGNQLWKFIWKTDAEIEVPKLWPPNVKSWLIGKDPDAGKDWGQEEKWGMEDEVVIWHHLLNGYEFEQTLGDSEGQGSLACCSQWGHKELDIT